MKYIILNLALVLLALSLPLLQWRKERILRRKAEKMLDIVRKIGELDDRIFRMRLLDPEDWPRSPEAKMLVAKRIELHERYTALLGHTPLRECEYMNDLMRSGVSKKD